jgi:hypothetical protein
MAELPNGTNDLVDQSLDTKVVATYAAGQLGAA